MFPIDVDKEILINLVHERPALWDKYSKTYKQLHTKKECWREICRVFKKDFDKLDQEEQEECARLVTKVWTRIRDAWVKNLNDKVSKRPESRPYKYHKQLLFLKKVIKSSDVHQVVEYGNEKDNDDGSDSEDSDIVQSIDEDVLECADTRSKRKKTHDITKIMISDPVVTESDTTLDDRHLAFFKSIQPTVIKFNDDQFLEFQAGVLSVIQRIRSEQRNTNWDQPHTSTNVSSKSPNIFRTMHVKRSPSSDSN